jgi:molecular chaperone GrpE
MKNRKDKSQQDNPKALRKELETVRQQLETVQAERDELLGKLQRVSADYANFQKRVPKQVSDSVAFQKESLIKTFLPALDNFERTLEKSHSAESVDVVLDGVRIVYDQMADVLKSHGVEVIQAIDEPFDPMQHEAMLRREDLEREDSVVLEEFQKGYRLNGRVIRPSKVVVNRIHLEEKPQPQEIPEQATDEAEPTSEQ